MDTTLESSRPNRWLPVSLAALVGLAGGVLGAVGYQFLTEEDDLEYEFASVCETLDVGPYLRLFEPPMRAQEAEPTSDLENDDSGTCSYSLGELVAVSVDVDIAESAEAAEKLFDQRKQDLFETSPADWILTGGSRQWDDNFAVAGQLAATVVAYDENLVIDIKVSNQLSPEEGPETDGQALLEMATVTMNDMAEKLEK